MIVSNDPVLDFIVIVSLIAGVFVIVRILILHHVNRFDEDLVVVACHTFLSDYIKSLMSNTDGFYFPTIKKVLFSRDNPGSTVFRDAQQAIIDDCQDKINKKDLDWFRNSLLGRHIYLLKKYAERSGLSFKINI